MAKKKQTIEIAVLDELRMKQFDEFKKKQRLASRGRTADNAARALRDEIVGAMNGALLAKLPDGRMIQRVPQEIDYDAKPATTIKFDKLNEIAADEE